jgi:flagellar hook-basal body complex protein FliE
MVGAIGAMEGILSELATLAVEAGTSPSAPASQTAPAPGGGSFAAVFDAALSQLDGAVTSARQAATAFAGGNDGVPLSDVMMSLEQGNLALQLAANVRDKITAAYSNVMNMPV